MDQNENEGQNGNEEEQQGEEFSGWEELLYSLGQALRGKEGKTAIAKLLGAFAVDVERRAEHRKVAIRYSYALAAFMFVVVGCLGYLKVISGEITATLIAGLIGALYKRQAP
jgi:hypothetical protein